MFIYIYIYIYIQTYIYYKTCMKKCCSFIIIKEHVQNLTKKIQ